MHTLDRQILGRAEAILQSPRSYSAEERAWLTGRPRDLWAAEAESAKLVEIDTLEDRIETEIFEEALAAEEAAKAEALAAEEQAQREVKADEELGAAPMDGEVEADEGAEARREVETDEELGTPEEAEEETDEAAERHET